jgi:hypothetical protein
MTDARSVDSAVAAGVIDAAQAERLKSFLAERPVEDEGTDHRDEAAPTIDEEDFRLISSFNDIFVTIGLLALFLAVRGLAGSFAAPATAAVAWGAAEIFTRRHRMALPSIVLSIVFLFAAIIGGGALLAQATDGKPQTFFGALTSPPILCIALVAAVLHQRRFKTPFDALPIAGFLVMLVLTIVERQFEPADHRLLTLLAGLAVFGAAMRFDLSDPLRQTRRSDKAFWLHLLAAPLIVHSLLGGQLLYYVFEPSREQAWLLLLAVFILSVLAVLIDRRALIVSALSYLFAAVGTLTKGGGEIGQSFSLSLLVVGVMVLALSVGWRGLRRAILSRIPLPALTNRLPPARTE